MARKSRRNKSTEVNISQDIVKNKNLLDTAIYVRLSVENGGNETDETLVVQQMLVEKYIEEHLDDFIKDYQVCSFKKIVVEKESEALEIIEKATDEKAFDQLMEDFGSDSEDAGVVTKNSALDDI